MEVLAKFMEKAEPAWDYYISILQENFLIEELRKKMMNFLFLQNEAVAKVDK